MLYFLLFPTVQGLAINEGKEENPTTPPSEPFVMLPSRNAAWEIIISERNSESKEPKEQQASAKPVVATRISFVQTGDVEHQISYAGERVLEDVYRIKGVTLLKRRDQPEVSIDLYAARAISAKPGFDMLRWLTRDTYDGVVDHAGRMCHAFKLHTTISPISQDDVERGVSGDFKWSELEAQDRDVMATPEDLAREIDRYALVDVETKMPVLYQDKSHLYVFRFLPAPRQPITLPPPFAEKWKALLKATQRLVPKQK